MQRGNDSTLDLSQVLGASVRKGERAGSANLVQREHPQGRGFARLTFQHLHPPNPVAAAGRRLGSSILSTRCPCGPHPLGGWPWANLAKQPASQESAQGQTMSMRMSQAELTQTVE